MFLADSGTVPKIGFVPVSAKEILWRCLLWFGHISLRRGKDLKNTVLERECKTVTVEKYWQEGALRAESD